MQFGFFAVVQFDHSAADVPFGYSAAVELDRSAAVMASHYTDHSSTVLHNTVAMVAAVLLLLEGMEL